MVFIKKIYAKHEYWHPKMTFTQQIFTFTAHCAATNTVSMSALRKQTAIAGIHEAVSKTGSHNAALILPRTDRPNALHNQADLLVRVPERQHEPDIDHWRPAMTLDYVAARHAMGANGARVGYPAPASPPSRSGK